jgi:hypothetical protein
MTDMALGTLGTPLAAQAVALNRFGLGARPDEPPLSNPKQWVLDQLDR